MAAQPFGNTSLRRQLAFAARRLNLSMPRRLRAKFSQATVGGISTLRSFLVDSYLPSWYSGTDMEKFWQSDEGTIAIENHLFRRLEMDRYEFVPWIDSVCHLTGSRVIEIGCGTGSASVALAEQGANVIAIDVHREGLEASRLRAQAHCLGSISFVEGNAQSLSDLVPEGQYDLIVFFAVLEHMTLNERKRSLQAAWGLLPRGKHICIVETPNRLWYFDSHTSRLPFYNWLPEELAFAYSSHSLRYPFNARFREMNSESLLSFAREGRGFSFHEVDLALGEGNYKIVSDLTSFMSIRNPAKLIKRLLANDRRRESLLNSYAPDRDRGFFREYINIVIEKL